MVSWISRGLCKGNRQFFIKKSLVNDLYTPRYNEIFLFVSKVHVFIDVLHCCIVKITLETVFIFFDSGNIREWWKRCQAGLAGRTIRREKTHTRLSGGVHQHPSRHVVNTLLGRKRASNGDISRVSNVWLLIANRFSYDAETFGPAQRPRMYFRARNPVAFSVLFVGEKGKMSWRSGVIHFSFLFRLSLWNRRLPCSYVVCVNAVGVWSSAKTYRCFIFHQTPI